MRKSDNLQEQPKFSKKTTQSVCSKTKEIYIKNNIDIAVYSETASGNYVMQKKLSENRRRAAQVGFVNNANM